MPPECTAWCSTHERVEAIATVTKVSRERYALSAFHVEGNVACGGRISIITSAKNLIEMRKR